MRNNITQSATIRVPFMAYLAADHITPATAKTIAITISKNGAAFGNPSAGATNATGIANGWYYVDLSVTDTDTAGPLLVHGAEATIDPVDIAYSVVATGVGALTVAERNAIADATLLRASSNVETGAGKNLAGVVLKHTHRVADDGAGHLVTYRADGTTAQLTQAITAIDATLAPIKDLGAAA